jgi:hypothetical protein
MVKREIPMEYEDMSNEDLSLCLKLKVPEMPVDAVDDANRAAVIRVLRIARRVEEKRKSPAARRVFVTD